MTSGAATHDATDTAPPNAREELLTREALLARSGEPVHIIGAASAEGVATARLLRALGFRLLILHDSRERDDLRRAFRTTHGAYTRVEQDELWAELEPLLERGRFGSDYLLGVSDTPTATVVLGQGWYLVPDNRAAVRAAVPSSALVTSMSELYFTLARAPIVGVTGTNGKSTTVALIDHLLESAGVSHLTAGNERSSRQFLPEIECGDPPTVALLEISNRQLLQLPASPQVAAITSLTPDHLEEHGSSFEGYLAAKQRLFARQVQGDIAIFNGDSDACIAAAAVSAGRHLSCGIGRRVGGSVCWVDGELIGHGVPVIGSGRLTGPLQLASRRDLRLAGDHNLRNAAIAVAVALACGVAPEQIAPALRGFAGKSLRQELVGEVDGVEVYSDIKSTTPEATIAALDALAPPGTRALLIVGGDDKGLQYAGLAEAMRARRTDAFAVPGSATDALEREIAALGGALQRVETLEQALDAALGLASAGDRVIVSPAAAGFWTTQLQGKPSLRSLIRRRTRIQQEADDT